MITFVNVCNNNRRYITCVTPQDWKNDSRYIIMLIHGPEETLDIQSECILVSVCRETFVYRQVWERELKNHVIVMCCYSNKFMMSYSWHHVTALSHMMSYSWHHVTAPSHMLYPHMASCYSTRVAWCHIYGIMLQHPSRMMSYSWHHVTAPESHVISMASCYSTWVAWCHIHGIMLQHRVAWCHIHGIMLQHPSRMMSYPWHHVTAPESHDINASLQRIPVNDLISERTCQRWMFAHEHCRVLFHTKRRRKSLHHACPASTVTGSLVS